MVGTGGTEEGPAQEVWDMVQADNMNFLREKLTAFITGAAGIALVHLHSTCSTYSMYSKIAGFWIRIDLIQDTGARTDQNKKV
jgi:hypothetical protein